MECSADVKEYMWYILITLIKGYLNPDIQQLYPMDSLSTIGLNRVHTVNEEGNIVGQTT